MSAPRTEIIQINISRETGRRLRKACAKLRVSEDEIFEMGFNAVFPPETPRHMPRIKKPAAR